MAAHPDGRGNGLASAASLLDEAMRFPRLTLTLTLILTVTLTLTLTLNLTVNLNLNLNLTLYLTLTLTLTLTRCNYFDEDPRAFSSEGCVSKSVIEANGCASNAKPHPKLYP